VPIGLHGPTSPIVVIETAIAATNSAAGSTLSYCLAPLMTSSLQRLTGVKRSDSKRFRQSESTLMADIDASTTPVEPSCARLPNRWLKPSV